MNVLASVTNPRNSIALALLPMNRQNAISGEIPELQRAKALCSLVFSVLLSALLCAPGNVHGQMPVITAQPQDKTYPVGDRASTPAVEATGQDLMFHWYVGLPGDIASPITEGVHSQWYASLSAYYSFVELWPSATTRYWVRVSNALGFVDSRSVLITVVPGTRIINLAGNLDFGSLETNTAGSRTLTISNAGNLALKVRSISLPAGFTSDWVGERWFDPGGWVEVRITFTPLKTGTYGGLLIVDCDNTGGEKSMPVTGEGSAPSRTVQITSALEFNRVQSGLSARRTLLLRNTGASAVPLNGISLPAGFEAQTGTANLTSDWNGNLAWDQQLEVTVTFRPTAVADYAGMLVVRADLTEGEATCALTGTGTIRNGVVTVPDDQPTVNCGIDAAGDGDRVRVRPGTYYENVRFQSGKNLRLQSLYQETGDASYISSTVLHGNGVDAVVSIPYDQYGTIGGFTIMKGTWGIDLQAEGWHSDHRAFGEVWSNVIVSNSAGGIRLNADTYISAIIDVTSASATVRCSIGNTTIRGNGGPALDLWAAGRVAGTSHKRWATVACDIVGSELYDNAQGVNVYSSGPNATGSSTLNMAHCTLYRNGGAPLAASGEGSRLRLGNSVVWEDAAYRIADDGTAQLSATHCLFGEDGVPFPGAGNLYADPAFVNRFGGDFTLRPDSPCVDRGALIALVGDRRFNGAAPDLGAHESLYGTAPSEPAATLRLQLWADQVHVGLFTPPGKSYELQATPRVGDPKSWYSFAEVVGLGSRLQGYVTPVSASVLGNYPLGFFRALEKP